MKNPNEDKRTGIMFMWLGVIPVVWVVLRNKSVTA